ncbi:MAG: ABC transporter substrate-binding protein [Salinarimonadaceae bacterium]|nr:MAG: ABC transporter substrate-binding protein [Salinarimonadaceae bacterium]
MVKFNNKSGLVAGLVFMMGMFGAFEARTGASAQSLPTVQLYSSASIIEIDQAALFLGGPLGFFEEEGVNVQFGSAAGSAATLQLLASGQIEMGHIGMDVLILAKATNPDLPVTAVYLHYRGNIYEIVVPEAGDIMEVKDLDGKNIGVANLASGAIPSLRATLSEAGLNPNTSVGLIPVGIGAQALATLNAGRVDALALFRAQHAAIEASGSPFRYFTREAPSTVIAVNTAFLERNPEAVASVLRGVVKGSVFATLNPEQTVREHWGLYGRPQGLTEEEAMNRSKHILSRTVELWKEIDDDSVRWGEMSDAEWDTMQEFLISQNLLSQKVPSEGLFTAGLIDDVNAVDLSDVTERARR